MIKFALWWFSSSDTSEKKSTIQLFLRQNLSDHVLIVQ